MTDFYTNVQCVGNNILYRGIQNGKRVKQRVEYSPSLYFEYNPTPSQKPSFKTLDGKPLRQRVFGTIREARDLVKQNKNLSNGVSVYGNTRWEYAYIADQHKKPVDYDFDKLLIGIVDIEVDSENGFPEPELAEEMITSICITYLNGDTYVFSYGDYKPVGKEIYVKCKDEYSLCKQFLALWTKKCPDILTGWNSEFFDIPYIINRFRKIVGEEETKKLSPWNMIHEKRKFNKTSQRELTTYNIVGVSALDYMELYKWFAKDGKTRENHKLNTIANIELGESKISYDEYDSLFGLYRNDFQKFIEYNIKDVSLIVGFEAKLKLLETAAALAYDTKSNLDDVFAQTRMWDALTYSYLLNNKIIVPPKEIFEKEQAFEGAFVKEVQVGRHRWVSSFDLDSLHPHLMMQYNISPETIIEPENYTHAMRAIISNGINVDKMLNKEIDFSGLVGVTVTPNGQFYRTDFQGFLPKMLEEMYEDRKKFKKLQKEAERAFELETDPRKQFEISKTVSKYNNLQLAKKLAMNSAYGALGSNYFRFYDIRLALSVTISSQYSIKWIANKLNDYMNEILSTDKDFIIASDTDSVYYRLEELVNHVYGSKLENTPTPKVIEFMDKVCEDHIKPLIDKSYQELADYTHAFQQKMAMKREALADTGIWTGKKHYILNVWNNEGIAYKEPHMKVMGLQVVQGSTPSIVKVAMKESIHIMLNGKESDLQKHISEFRKQFMELPAEEIASPKGLSGLDKWVDGLHGFKKGTPIHTKGALVYNSELKSQKLDKKYEYIKEGSKVKYSYLKMPNHFKSTVISFPDRLPKEFGLEDFIDYNTQFDKTFLNPMDAILKCIGWQSKKISNLAKFGL